MKTEVIARLFTNGGSQAVRLPRDFRMPGDRVRLRRVGHGVLIEPFELDVDAWLDELKRLAAEADFPDRPEQPAAEERDSFD